LKEDRKKEPIVHVYSNTRCLTPSVDEKGISKWKSGQIKMQMVPIYSKGKPTRWRVPCKHEKGFPKWQIAKKV